MTACEVCGRPSVEPRCAQHRLGKNSSTNDRSTDERLTDEHSSAEGVTGERASDKGSSGTPAAEGSAAGEAKRSEALTERERLAADRERRIADRDHEADIRDDRADCRDDRADMMEARQADHDSEVNEILVAAEARDKQADFRDFSADRRDEAAALDVMVYGPEAERPFLARRQSAKDRKESRHDRTAGHIDRFLLSGVEASTHSDEDSGADGEQGEEDVEPGEAGPET